MNLEEIIIVLKSLENPDNIAGMARFGIITKKAFGISSPVLKNFAKDIKRQTKDCHKLAFELWKTGIHEARMLAYLIDDANEVTPEQMDLWAADFDNWAICDGTCGHLFCKTPYAYDKVFEWSAREEEFIKRAGIILIALLAIHDKDADDAKIAQFLPILEKKSDDGRNFIKKGVNWSLRQIGKRNLYLNGLAIETAERIKARNTKSANWIAAEALRELNIEKHLDRLRKRSLK